MLCSSSSSMELFYFVFLCIHISCYNRASDQGDASDQKVGGASDQNPGAADSTSSTDERPIEKIQIFSYRELQKAADNFSQKSMIGEGGFGRLYKGKLKTDQTVAVKMLNIRGEQGDSEFLSEIMMLSVLRHPNIVNFIGFSAERVERFVVYEFMPLGSLHKHLHDLMPGSKLLDWETRMTIALGTARGLNYLHNEATPSVVFRDLKTSNILLDEKFHPRLSDFGLAKFSPNGDQGYCAPEYYDTGRLTKKSDVYSFGVVLLELITGRKRTDIVGAQQSRMLCSWLLSMIRDQKKLYEELVDPRLGGQYKRSSLYHAAYLALKCLHPNPTLRRCMCDAVQQMKLAAFEPK